ncbi:hypothetical protein FB451DRAFT_1441699 [Mycena latifolia]|nr:hypothetical protein FB451DRAFT_1441699 [Mycena latifolia]
MSAGHAIAVGVLRVIAPCRGTVTTARQTVKDHSVIYAAVETPVIGIDRQRSAVPTSGSPLALGGLRWTTVQDIAIIHPHQSPLEINRNNITETTTGIPRGPPISCKHSTNTSGFHWIPVELHPRLRGAPCIFSEPVHFTLCSYRKPFIYETLEMLTVFVCFNPDLSARRVGSWTTHKYICENIPNQKFSGLHWKPVEERWVDSTEQSMKADQVRWRSSETNIQSCRTVGPIVRHWRVISTSVQRCPLVATNGLSTGGYITPEVGLSWTAGTDAEPPAFGKGLEDLGSSAKCINSLQYLT